MWLLSSSTILAPHGPEHHIVQSSMASRAKEHNAHRDITASAEQGERSAHRQEIMPSIHRALVETYNFIQIMIEGHARQDSTNSSVTVHPTLIRVTTLSLGSKTTRDRQTYRLPTNPLIAYGVMIHTGKAQCHAPRSPCRWNERAADRACIKHEEET